MLNFSHSALYSVTVKDNQIKFVIDDHDLLLAVNIVEERSVFAILLLFFFVIVVVFCLFLLFGCIFVVVLFFCVVSLFCKNRWQSLSVNIFVMVIVTCLFRYKDNKQSSTVNGFQHSLL